MNPESDYVPPTEIDTKKEPQIDRLSELELIEKAAYKTVLSNKRNLRIRGDSNKKLSSSSHFSGITPRRKRVSP